jgi:predicted alpha/beta-hydrolase family hydrolase
MRDVLMNLSAGDRRDARPAASIAEISLLFRSISPIAAPGGCRYNRDRMRTYSAAAANAPVLALAPGAGAGEDHPWMQRTGRGLASRGVTVVTFDFPYRLAGRRLPDRNPVLEEAYRAAWRTIAADHPAAAAFCIGGKSMGGRIATQVTAAGDLAPVPAAVVCFGYPLHPPGRGAQRRDRHLPSIACPILFLHGSRDPFGWPDEMRELVTWIPRATLSLVDGGDHSLALPARQDADGRAFERVLETAAAWILETTTAAA